MAAKLPAQALDFQDLYKDMGQAHLLTQQNSKTLLKQQRAQQQSKIQQYEESKASAADHQYDQ